MRRSTDPHDLGRGQRQGSRTEHDTLTPWMTPIFGGGCHAQVRETALESVENDTLTGSRISRCAREDFASVVAHAASGRALSRVGDCVWCQGVILHVMCRCFADLGMTSMRFSRVSWCHGGCHPGTIRHDDADAPTVVMPDDGSSGPVAALSCPASALSAPPTPSIPSPTAAPARAAPTTLRFAAPTVAREDWCA